MRVSPGRGERGTPIVRHGRDWSSRSSGRASAYRKVQFPNLTRFVDTLVSKGTNIVHVDVFEEVRQAELSFLFYITPTLFVTAVDPSGFTVYEYQEPLETVISESRRLSKGTPVESARLRMAELEAVLRSQGFEVQPGRCAVPVEFPVSTSKA